VTAQTDSVYTGEKNAERKSRERKAERFAAFREKIFFGGNFNVFFTTNASVVSLNPSVGYKITDKFHAGTGMMFSYYSSSFAGQRFNSLFYGPHVFARYFISEGIYFQAQYDRLYQPLINYSQGTVEQGWMDYYLAGAGIRRRFSSRAFWVASIMYNFNYKANQPSAYINPLIQFGIFSGF
jgi:hypothetical protein